MQYYFTNWITFLIMLMYAITCMHITFYAINVCLYSRNKDYLQSNVYQKTNQHINLLYVCLKDVAFIYHVPWSDNVVKSPISNIEDVTLVVHL